MRLPVYLDYMATTPIDLRVKEKMDGYTTIDGVFGNPASSTHNYGIAAREAVELARARVANLIGAEPNEIIWTSGASEANNLAIKGAVNFYHRKGKHIITCQTEHKAVLDVCGFLETQGYKVTYLKPEKNGLIDLNKVQSALRKDTVLISIMAVNNEIGVTQNLKAIADLVKPKGIIFHVDAAQAIGKIPFNIKALGIDLVSMSAHKIYGPKGIGALYFCRQPRIRLEPMLHGGGHEFGLRSGTLATHQIVGMGTAFELAGREMQEDVTRIAMLRDRLWSGLQKLDDVYLNGDLQQRIAHNLNISFAGVCGMSLVTEMRDVAVSASSACMSANVEPSYVLKAIGVSNSLALNSLRFSLGKYTTEEEIDFTIAYVSEVVKKLRS